jgi:hypothetical protein
MRILFGPEHDGLHIDPNEPNGYEWWYFDAISDDERYVLVVIFFLGTPMSPYYKAVVDGKNPLPKDWCGVFITLHEKTRSGYVERGYAYNIYSEKDLNLNPDYGAPFGLGIGKSKVMSWPPTSRSKPKHRWRVSVNERTLWLGTLSAKMSFEARAQPQPDPIAGHNDHTWVCVAPVCKAEGWIFLKSGGAIRFSGKGYHDHNFGALPWSDTRLWEWGRGRVSAENGSVLYPVFYWNHTHTSATGQKTNTGDAFLLLLDSQGRVVHHTASAWGGDSYGFGTRTGKYGLKSVGGVELLSEATRSDGVRYKNALSATLFDSPLSESPFYERGVSRYTLHIEKDSVETVYTGTGIAEVFEPARLCGPIISRMMWTRIRRRS